MSEDQRSPTPTRELRVRYAREHLRVLDDDESRRFVPANTPDPQFDRAVAWELLYRVEPTLFERLSAAAPLHASIVEWLPRRVGQAVEVGALTGRLTAEIVARCDRLVAVEPAQQLWESLAARVGPPGDGRVSLARGFRDALPIEDGWAELVVTGCGWARDPRDCDDIALAEMERVCAPGGRVVVVWPTNRQALSERGYRHLTFPGEMHLEFQHLDEAIELAGVFFPRAVPAITRHGRSQVPYSLLNLSPPRDLAYKVL